jgi:hypothetical protein
MPKIVANSSRKPPEPSGDHSQIERWIAGSMPEIQPILTEVDRMICETIPDLSYAVKWKKAYYGLEELGWIIELAGYHVTANVVFHGGIDLDPPPPLGETGRSRYVKLHSVEEARAPGLRGWIEQAARFPGWK